MNVPTRLAVGAFALSLLIAGTEAAHGSPKSLSGAKKAGIDAKNCQYCHTEALPKKETFKPEALNDRGKFLLDDQKKRNLKEPDPAALKNFPADAGKK